jgi:hypothetical protein
MVTLSDLKEISPKVTSKAFSSGHIVGGLPIPKQSRIELFSSAEWEQFVEEWSSSLKDNYVAIRRFSSAGDKGIDIAAFLENAQFADGWDNYQCKHYNAALRPTDIWIEIGKVIYYTYIGEYPAPRKYFFVAPKGLGTSLLKLLADPEKLKAEFLSNWDKYCREGITSTAAIDLQGELLNHANDFDYSIFDTVTLVQLVEQHATTPFHSVRFGGGLPPREHASPPPTEIHPSESRYVQQLFDVYSEAAGAAIKGDKHLEQHPDLQSDFLRQRERFYSAEALRNFARDNVPTGTFESLQEEAFHGVIDSCAAAYANGLERMRETLKQALSITFASNPLFSVINVRDKQGICHQLANIDRLKWMASKSK